MTELPKIRGAIVQMGFPGEEKRVWKMLSLRVGICRDFRGG